jgi:hypothetical protein
VSVLDQKVERVVPNALQNRRSACRSRISGLGTSRSTQLRLLPLLFLIVLPVLGHDIYSSWTEANLRPERLELTLTLARASAVRLLADANALPPITPDNFPEYAPRLKAVAPDLFEITSAGKALKLGSTEVKISGDADVTFHLVYPRPAAGALRFVVSYLFHLVDGHVGTLVVTDPTGKDLGWSPVSVDQPVFEVVLPAAAARKR